MSPHHSFFFRTCVIPLTTHNIDQIIITGSIPAPKNLLQSLAYLKGSTSIKTIKIHITEIEISNLYQTDNLGIFISNTFGYSGNSFILLQKETPLKYFFASIINFSGIFSYFFASSIVKAISSNIF